MSEITVSVSGLEDAISKMQSLQSAWESNDTAYPTTVGGGSVVSEFEKIAQLYQQLNSNMVTLAGNTASFLSNLKRSYDETDQKIAADFQRV